MNLERGRIIIPTWEEQEESIGYVDGVYTKDIRSDIGYEIRRVVYGAPQSGAYMGYKGEEDGIVTLDWTNSIPRYSVAMQKATAEEALLLVGNIPTGLIVAKRRVEGEGIEEWNARIELAQSVATRAIGLARQMLGEHYANGVSLLNSTRRVLGT